MYDSFLRKNPSFIQYLLSVQQGSWFALVPGYRERLSATQSHLFRLADQAVTHRGVLCCPMTGN
ncbi:MAG: hypothetical protein GY924_07600 [Planctomycetaceae bacterium]|nr:hypothetical protein [Planctomycetaceae bacterium]